MCMVHPKGKNRLNDPKNDPPPPHPSKVFFYQQRIDLKNVRKPTIPIISYVGSYNK